MVKPPINSRNNRIYYVVQSKWNNRNNALKDIDSKEVGYALNNFSTILRGYKKPTQNDSFNQKLSDLQAHIEKNGRVKFIFLNLVLVYFLKMSEILFLIRKYR